MSNFAASDLETQRHRDNEIDALEQKLARADARIAELERECSQWRDELRIYRETENKRIAELEQSVTVRDTEIARLETDLELAELDSDRLTWLLKWLAAPENCRNIRFTRPMIDACRADGNGESGDAGK